MVETTHPGNIGAAARAMKTMGYNNLYLVKPKIYPNAEATARAAGADDILARAVVCDSLEEALQGCVTVVASTARPRTISHLVFTPREYAEKLTKILLEQIPDDLAFERSGTLLAREAVETAIIKTKPSVRKLTAKLKLSNSDDEQPAEHLKTKKTRKKKTAIELEIDDN